MKQTFQMQDPKHAPPRVAESIKNRVRKYLKRERRKTLPDGVDFWDFDCKIGRTEEGAEVAHVSAVITAIDTAFNESWEQIYIEILAKAGHRMKRAGSEGKVPPNDDQ